MLDVLKQRADRYHDLGKQIEDPAVYGNNKLFADYQRERGMLREQADAYAAIVALQAQIAGSEEILKDPAADSEMKELAEVELGELKERYDRLYAQAQDMILLDDEDDARDVILEIRGAEGGDEATLFARELIENYARWCAHRGFKLEVLDEVESEAGGLKNGTYRIKGDQVWKAFKYEGGGHRVQRVPVTETQGRIHTSLATVAVLPEMEDVKIEVKESDLEVTAARSGGPGGQNVNKTSSRCQMRHLPSGLFVDCQATPSFHKNRDEALRILKSKLYQMEKEKRDREQAAKRGVQVGSGGRGDKIRTYNFPQDRCTDHRSKESFPLQKVMAGDLDPLIDSCRKWEKEEKLKALSAQTA
ncbi:MAG: PCRF domain-containing protein [Planctomycetes bacterium]|nr:PCRF domain-containing protein [Planctomycetota bacterium]